MEEIEVRGERLEDVKRNFLRPRVIPWLATGINVPPY
jgi:hypothetical protein